MWTPRGQLTQIVPADGWWALYRMKEAPYFDVAAVAAWGLLLAGRTGPDEPGWEVVGLGDTGEAPSLGLLGDAENFDGYVRADEITDAAKALWTQQFAPAEEEPPVQTGRHE